MCLLYDGTPEGSTESGFMEKPGIEPATPGLQGIALIHYNTGLNLVDLEGDSVTDGRRRLQYPDAFFKKSVGITKDYVTVALGWHDSTCLLPDFIE